MCLGLILLLAPEEPEKSHGYCTKVNRILIIRIILNSLERNNVSEGLDAQFNLELLAPGPHISVSVVKSVLLEVSRRLDDGRSCFTMLRTTLGRNTSTWLSSPSNLLKHSPKNFYSYQPVTAPLASARIRERVLVGQRPYQLLDLAKWSRSTDTAKCLHTDSTRLSFDRPDRTIDESLLRLDTEIRKTGRINRREIEEILEDIREMKSATSSQSLMIIRCCGDLVPEEIPENRTKLVQEIWKTMENLHVPMDISHYNALLRVYIENEYKFNPTEFLKQLDSKGIDPNRVTYQRLITRFCQDGDIDGASTILQHMKEKQLPINAHVFNALILGHSNANDMESAEGIIGVMKQAGLEPNDDTYATLMIGYAKKGDLGNVKRIVQECEQKDIHLIDRDFLEIIFVLASSGHENLIDEVIPLLRRRTGFNQDATNTILRLATIGKEDVAYKLLKCMTRSMRPGQDELNPSGNFFIKQMVLASTPSEKIIKVCNMMMNEDLNKEALLRATEMALSFQKFDKATDFIEALHESGFPIRQHYFWPFFARSTSEKDVYDGLKSMIYTGLNPNQETLRDYVIPSLLSHGIKKKEYFEETLDKLTSYTRIPLASVVPAALQYLLQLGDMNQACRLALQYRVKFTQQYVRRALVDAYIKTKDANSLVRLVASSGLEDEDLTRESVGLVLMELMDVVRIKKVDFLLPILKELLASGVGLSNSGAELIQNNLGDQITPEVTNLILQLTSADLKPKLELFQIQRKKTSSSAPATELEALSTIQIENMLSELAKAGKVHKGLQKALLIHYCREKELEKADRLYEELKGQDFTFTVGMKALLLDLYSNCNNLEKAKSLYKEISQSGVDATLDDTKILSYVYALVSNEEYQEAFEVIKSQPITRQNDDQRRAARNNFQVNGAVWKVLHAIAEKGSVEKVQEAFKLLTEQNFGQLNTMVLGPLVEVHLVKDDLDGALKEFERCVNEFNVTPLKQELFCRFIKMEDPERLQKILDLSTKQHGEVNSLYDLVFAFLECGKVRQAKKILETPGLRTRNEKLELTCQKYYEEDRVSELENLIEITKDLFNVDRNSLYFYLLKAYCKAGDADKALSVWTSLQEENIQASPDLLVYLADFLRSKDRQVPFVVPEPAAVQPAKSRQASPVSDRQVQKEVDQDSIDYHLSTNNLDRALEFKQTMDAEGKYLTIKDVSRLIDKLARAERLRDALKITEQVLDGGLHPYPRVLHYLLGRLSAAGEVEGLLRIEGKLSNELKRRTLFNSRLCVAYVNVGQGKQFFNDVIKKEVQAFLAGEKEAENAYVMYSASSYLLLRNEDLLPEFEQLASATAEKGNKHLYNSVWSYHMIKHNFNKANEIWETQLKNEERILFKSVSIHAVTSNDEEGIRLLEEKVMAAKNVSKLEKGQVASDRIRLLCNLNKPEEALEVLNQQLKHISLTDYSLPPLEILKSKLEAKNIKFPHELPKQGARRRQNAESSSSSDSDSD